eukprot:c24738_g1_i1 orf=536-1168(+)
MESFGQVVIFILGLALFWAVQSLAKVMVGPSRSRGRAKAQAQRHFVKGAQVLARSRSAGSAALGRSLAREASEEADKAIALDPRDAASHVLKALALEQQGHLSAALRSMHTALSPPALRTLSQSEKADAYMKRAGLLMASSKGKRAVDSAIEDLNKSLELSSSNAKVHCLLGMCLEKKHMYAEALKSYQDAFALDQNSDEARAGLMRLRP